MHNEKTQIEKITDMEMTKDMEMIEDMENRNNHKNQETVKTVKTDSAFFSESLKCLKSLMQIFVESAKSAKSAKSIFATFATFASAIFVGKASCESTVRYRVKSRIPSCYLRSASVIALICFLGVGNVWGAVSTLTFTSACGGSGTAGDGATWTVTSDASESTYDGTKGVHYGTGSAYVSYVQLSNSTIAGRKTQVVVNASGASSTSAVISVTVGSTTFLCGGKETVTVSTTATAYTFTGVGTGNIVVSISQQSAQRAIYCKSIAVTYSTDKYTVNFDKGSGVCVTTSLKETNAGDGVELPVATPPSDCVTKGWVFAGWKESSAVSSPTFAEPKVFEAEATYYPTADNTTLYAVYKLSEERTGCTEGKVNATGDLAVGDCVILYYESGKAQYNGLGDYTYGTKTSYTTTPDESAHVLEVQEGNSTGQLAFYDKTDKNYLSYSGSSNELKVADEVNANSSWVVTVTSGVATIQNASVTTRYIKYNTSSPRFAGYLSDAGNTSFVNLYKVCPPIVTYYSNPDCTYDYFVDIMHDTEVEPTQGTYAMPAALSDASKGEDYCDEKHYHFIGWVEESDINENGTLKAEATVYPAGDGGHTAANKTFYAIWAKEE